MISLLGKLLKVIPKDIDPDKAYVIVSPHVGDIYAFCSLSKEVKQLYNLKKIVLITPKKFHQLVSCFKDIDEVTEISDSLAEFFAWLPLSHPLKLQPLKSGSLNICSPGLFEKLFFFNGYNFWHVFRLKMGIQDRLKFKLIPDFPEASSDVIKLKNEYEGHQKKLFIFPLARAIKTTKEIKSVFRQVVETALSNGWIIFANDIPDYLSDMPLIPARFSLIDTIHFANFAGNVLTIRSGITDLLTNASAKIAVLYPNLKTTHLFGKTTIKDYFPVSDFEMRAVMQEFTISESVEQIAKEIIRFFQLEFKDKSDVT
ncbi:hypothetical protein Ferpe_1861 [Fervidobacterium pennivorans DSM 9078]|uniref:ADP-heptose:LPS heptosyltransferase n=1 Tax=Fervidobacterium pennivorans (strain DSM 9078 / Ven5) TaxID=771875 RepID=H9UEG8_FERPD|nr:hypothetical protein [Fervidobacterium pennivorans]AFG35911.1 hypothetical protein Ferpe_1861 [Fervidobacterium pennivorans DSM 9078]